MNPSAAKNSYQEVNVSDQPTEDNDSPMASAVVLDEEAGVPTRRTSGNDTRSATAHCLSCRWMVLSLFLLGIVGAGVSILILRHKNDASDNQITFVPPFQESIPLLSKKVLEGYANKSEFEADLQKVVESYINGVSGQQIGVQRYASFGFATDPDVILEDANLQAAPSRERSKGNAVGDNVNDYGTNNQERGVEEGDKVVTDGKVGKCT